jgi:pimeloyl-ACP methyl ester carboxylesterase
LGLPNWSLKKPEFTWPIPLQIGATMSIRSILATVLAALAFSAEGSAKNQHAGAKAYNVSDAALVKTLPGFKNSFATVNGIRLHYVAGGEGDPVFLLPGWPETWWSYHKIMPELAKRHRVISIDLRGMGSSDKPAGGYDKKSMAGDISELVRQLGYKQVDVIGHDIGSMVAFSFAANHADQVHKLVMLDVTHPSTEYLSLPLLPALGTFGDKLDENHPYLWWFAFHQVKGLPEQLLEGRTGIEQEWFFRYMLKDEGAIDARDRAVYAAAYSSRDAIRAGDAWYQAFPQDIVDDGTYAKLTMPVLGLGGPGYPRLKSTLDAKAPGSRTFRIEGSGHFIAEEKPAALLAYLGDFLN